MNESIFRHQLFLGYVSKINIHNVTIHIPSSTNLNNFFHQGERFHGGTINGYIVIEGENRGFIGKVISSEIPEKERLELSSIAFKRDDFHPLLQAEILSVFDYRDVNFNKSIVDFPNVGCKVYMASNQFIEHYAKGIELQSYSLKTNNFASLISPNSNSDLELSFQALFSRHAAIIGSTGSGKSWTTSNLISNLLENNQKVVLIDPTGEYRKLANEYSADKNKIILGESHILSYKNLKLQDLFHLLKPAPSAQAPKLREAVRSLKLLKKFEDKLVNLASPEKNYIVTRGSNIKTIIKEGKERDAYLKILNDNINEVSVDNSDFDIRGLADQVQQECVWPTGRYSDNHLFGGADESTLGHCSTLITRIESLVNDQFYNQIFDFTQTKNFDKDLVKALREYLEENSYEVELFYIDVSKVPFSFEMREVVVDIIGQLLLNTAREGRFKEDPVTVFADEAHQFMNKSVTTDNDVMALEAFESIAKEGRKYGLFLCITTQLPRDLPIGILSQIGTFITHRLINQRDKEIVMHSLPLSNRDIINYLPALGQGEVIISSTELKDVLFARINSPRIEPDSHTPIYSDTVIKIINDENIE